MKFQKSVHFPGPLDRVLAMLADPDFRAEVAEAAGAEQYDVDVTSNGTTIHATVTSTQSTAGMPSAATRFLGSSYQIRQQEIWSGHRGSIDVTIPGKPGTVKGTVSLAELGEHVVQSVEAEIKVLIPFVGSKVEQLIGRALGHVLKVQERVGHDWLNR